MELAPNKGALYKKNNAYIHRRGFRPDVEGAVRMIQMAGD
jgi:hypothetical protein